MADDNLSEQITFKTQDGIAHITINRPNDENRLTPPLMGWFAEIVETLRDDDSVQAVIITGVGRQWFSAGLMNPQIRAAMTKDEVIAYVRLGNRVFDALEALPQVIIAAINGTIMAGAAELALACDIRMVGDHVTLTLPEAKWGGFPGAGGPMRLATAVGQGHALELVATAKTIDAAEMERIGFAHHVYTADEVPDKALETARAIAANGPLATRGAKRIMRVRHEPGFLAARDLADALRYALEWSADVDEGLAAAQEGRPPRFTGR